MEIDFLVLNSTPSNPESSEDWKIAQMQSSLRRMLIEWDSFEEHTLTSYIQSYCIRSLFLSRSLSLSTLDKVLLSLQIGRLVIISLMLYAHCSLFR